MKTIAVTGATGFVGKRLMLYNSGKFNLQALALRGIPVHNINLAGVDAVVHLAGKAHQMEPIADDIYFDVNYTLTKQLADKAKADGVRQFIYISSTKVYGDDLREFLNEQSPCTPTDAYGASKLKAEQYLQSLQSGTFKVALIRPPLVYGPEVKGNMIRLLQLAAKPFPLPFGKINNARSMVFVDNLIELINTVVEQEATGIFIAGDIRPLSTTALIIAMRKSLNNKKKLISIPPVGRKLIKRFKPALYTRLFGSFEADNTNTNANLQFSPPYATEDGIAQMVNWFKNSRR